MNWFQPGSTTAVIVVSVPIGLLLGEIQLMAFSFELASKRSVEHLWMMSSNYHILSFILKIDWHRSNCLGLLFSFMLFQTTDDSLQSLWMKSRSSWKQSNSGDDCTEPQEFVIALLCGSLYNFFFPVLQHFSDQKLLLLFSFMKLNHNCSVYHVLSQADNFPSGRRPSPVIGFAVPLRPRCRSWASVAVFRPIVTR